MECAFGMLVQRWAILRSAIPSGVSLRKTTALVMALGKLHNFCIDRTDTNILPSTEGDELDLLSRDTGSIPLEATNGNEGGSTDDNLIPRQLIGGGDHFEDIPRGVREVRRRMYQDVRLPRERLAEDYVRENNYQRPRPRGTTS